MKVRHTPTRRTHAILALLVAAALVIVGCSDDGGSAEADSTVAAIAVTFEGYDGTPLEDAVGTYEAAAETFRDTVAIDGEEISPEPIEVRSAVRAYRAALFDLDAAVREDAPPSNEVNSVLEAIGTHIANLDELMVADDDELIPLAEAAAETGGPLRGASDALAAELSD